MEARRSGEPATDRFNSPVVDPTFNVLQLVAAAIERQDDLRSAETTHIHEIMNMREKYQGELRAAESGRIDAIRSVDVGAVQRAAEVQAQSATTLAAQVATSAETLRGQVAAAAIATANALAAALEPHTKAIEDLRRAQYEQQGRVGQAGEGKQDQRAGIALAISAVSVIVSVLVAVVLIIKG
jgi:hypothetical protein